MCSQNSLSVASGLSCLAGKLAWPPRWPTIGFQVQTSLSNPQKSYSSARIHADNVNSCHLVPGLAPNASPGGYLLDPCLRCLDSPSLDFILLPFTYVDSASTVTLHLYLCRSVTLARLFANCYFSSRCTYITIHLRTSLQLQHTLH